VFAVVRVGWCTTGVQIGALNGEPLRGYNRPFMGRATTSPPRPPLRQIRSAVLALVAVCLLGAGCGPPTRVIQGPDRPNIILILTDDLDARLLEDHMEDYPNLRELAAEGTTFENAFVTDSLCCPSRTSILRGQYAHNHEIVGNSWPRGGSQKFRVLRLGESTVATWLQDEGYRTVLIGKYMNGYYGTRVPVGWDDWYAIAGDYLSNKLNENGRIRHYNPKRYHLDDVLSGKATGYLRHAADEGSPFFMWLGTKAPHAPALPAPRDAHAFLGARLPRPPSFDEEDVSDKPNWVRNNPPLDRKQIASMEDLYRKRLQSMLSVDDMIGHLVDTLKKNGELNNTYIFFTSDNGFHMGQHRLTTGKWTAYEEDIRVPLIVRGPGVPEGRTLPHLVLNNDFAPTFADLAGAKTPSFVDGRSLVPLLTDDLPSPNNWRQAFLVEAAASEGRGPPSPLADEGSIKPLLTGDPLPEGWRRAAQSGEWSRVNWGRPRLEAIRTAEHLYVEYETGERELYDLEEDPYEVHNLYENAGSDLVRRAEGRLAALRGCSGADCRAAESGH
jgi:N-acetylglucosamine-6-sulfatase